MKNHRNILPVAKVVALKNPTLSDSVTVPADDAEQLQEISLFRLTPLLSLALTLYTCSCYFFTYRLSTNIPSNQLREKSLNYREFTRTSQQRQSAGPCQ